MAFRRPKNEPLPNSIVKNFTPAYLTFQNERRNDQHRSADEKPPDIERVHGKTDAVADITANRQKTGNIQVE